MYVRHRRSGTARISMDEEKEKSREAVCGESAHTSLKTHCLQYVRPGASVEPNFVVSCQQAGSCQQQRCKLLQRTRCVSVEQQVPNVCALVLLNYRQRRHPGY